MGKLTRKVRIEANDTKEGMTAGEIIDALLQMPGDMVPKVEIRMSGKIKAINLEVMFNAQ